MQYITKKLTFALFLLTVITVMVMQHFTVSNLCTFNEILDRSCMHNLASLRDLLLYLGLILVPVVATLPLKQSIFEAWKRFAIWAGPVTAFLSAWVLNLPSGGGMGVGSAAGAFLTIALTILGLYYVASLVIIVRAWNFNKAK